MRNRYKKYGEESIEDKLNILNEPAGAYGMAPIQFNPFEHIAISQAGLPIDTVSKLSIKYRLTNARIAAIFGISEKTLRNRVLKNDTLKTYEADLALCLIELYSEGMETFGYQESFIKWMNSEWESLQFKSPIDMINSVSGINYLKEELRNIREGVFA